LSMVITELTAVRGRFCEFWYTIIDIYLQTGPT